MQEMKLTHSDTANGGALNRRLHENSTCLQQKKGHGGIYPLYSPVRTPVVLNVLTRSCLAHNIVPCTIIVLYKLRKRDVRNSYNCDRG